MSEIRMRRYQPSDVDDLISLFRESVRRVARRHYTHDQVGRHRAARTFSTTDGESPGSRL